MTTLTGTPYGQTETGAAYTTAAALLNDEFDTSGTPIGFCPLCEHAPCVAGGNTWCAMSPRSSTVWRMEREIEDALGYGSPDALLLRRLLDTVAFIAAGGDEYAGQYARRRLEKELAGIRAAKLEEAQS